MKNRVIAIVMKCPSCVLFTVLRGWFKISRFFQNQPTHITEEEKQKIAASPFWDAQWYVQTYHPAMPLAQALDYYCGTGWLRGEAPSKIFDKQYLVFCLYHGINPVLYYEKYGCAKCPISGYNAYKSAEDEKTIQDFLAYQPTRKAKGVVYTCITNDYDDIHEIETHHYVDREWDYVCFTDNKEDIAKGRVGIWQIRPLQFSQSDNTRNQRWHKMHPHLLFPEYLCSCWIDGNVNILSNTLFLDIEQKKENFLVPIHFKNTNIYQEYESVMQANLDDVSIVEKERNLIVREGMPVDYSTPETNILFRKHHEPVIKELDENWWHMIATYSKRDQLAAAFLMWKAGVKPENVFLRNTRLSVHDFYVFSHKKGK